MYYLHFVTPHITAKYGPVSLNIMAVSFRYQLMKMMMIELCLSTIFRIEQFLNVVSVLCLPRAGAETRRTAGENAMLCETEQDRFCQSRPNSHSGNQRRLIFEEDPTNKLKLSKTTCCCLLYGWWRDFFFFWDYYCICMEWNSSLVVEILLEGEIKGVCCRVWRKVGFIFITCVNDVISSKIHYYYYYYMHAYVLCCRFRVS